MSNTSSSKQQRKRATYLAGHRAGWAAGLRLAGLDPTKFKYVAPSDVPSDVPAPKLLIDLDWS